MISCFYIVSSHFDLIIYIGLIIVLDVDIIFIDWPVINVQYSTEEAYNVPMYVSPTLHRCTITTYLNKEYYTQVLITSVYNFYDLSLSHLVVF